jgi:dipeptidyl aminopeptidase/acylaminoacyl peptidase
MNYSTSRLFLAAFLGAVLSASAAPVLAAQAGSSRPPVEAFFENSTFSNARISPSGRYLAARVATPGGRDRLSVVKLEDMSVTVVAVFSDADVGQFDWVNDERLVFTSRDKQTTLSDDRLPPGIYAVNRDGSGMRQLSETDYKMGVGAGTASHIGNNMLSWNHQLVAPTAKRNSNDVYIEKLNFTPNYSDVTARHLLRLDTVTGRAVSINTPPDSVGWIFDQNDEPRIAITEEAHQEALYYRRGDGENASWQRLIDSAPFLGASYSPAGIGPDGSLYVTSRAKGDYTALYRFNLGTRELAKEPLLAIDGYDVQPSFGADGNGMLIIRDGKLIGLRYLADVPGVAWLDKASGELQQKLDALLPGHVNLIDLPLRPETPWVLVRSESDAQPPVWLLFNKDSQKLTVVGRNLSAIRSEQMGRRVLEHYQARDGMQIPLWVTYPHGSTRKQLPAVVLVHGGPFLRGGEWGWNADAQFLASRGYAVLEPEFRGSTGYGWKLFRAGWKQWGRAMQDDIADGVKWAEAQGIVDPKRVCIAGASYGGYAVLMGLVNDPALYKCGVEWAGVTDIKLMYTGSWSAASDLTDRWKTYGMPNLIGDLVKDADQLKATSPLEQAARIKAPLLLAYGTDDQRVPLYHGEKFLAAVKAGGNQDVEWVTYEKEGHGWMLPENRYDWWRKVEKFLDKNIGQGPQ